ncbi:ribonuclease P protein component [Arthrobacter sp. GCM10027362]|uniref:ribonuclease P protein component n=1 Tax=Arthrobacter sp. GCM10027362 TaxID=3273379 RepID=UPI00362BC995
MLSGRNRMRSSADFSTTVRSGARSGRRNLVLYAAPAPVQRPTVFGFIVSKAVGNAVTRNLVKRRLREIAALSLKDHPEGLSIVVRALPAAASADFAGLGSDYRKALSAAVARLRPAKPVDAASTQKGSEE